MNAGVEVQLHVSVDVNKFHVQTALLPRAKCFRHPVSRKQAGPDSRSERNEIGNRVLFYRFSLRGVRYIYVGLT